MNEGVITEIPTVPLVHRIATRAVLNHIAGWRAGSITVVLPNSRTLRFGDPSSSRQVKLNIRDWRFFWKNLTAADIGNAESYMDGHWEVSDLVELCRLFLLDQNMLKADSVWTALNRVRHTLIRWSQQNTLTGSRKNIRYHYDLSNDFYRLFLDDSLTYSCATYVDGNETLAEAQQKKIADICKRLELRPGMRLLEIGSGWGSLAIHAAREYGVKVTSLTLSEQQLALARQRVAAAGLSDQIELRLCDYRDAEGTYDRIVSIEMLEAVGYEFLGTFFERCAQRLEPDGLMLLQVITFDDRRFDDYRRDFDFIRKYIFPGGLCPSIFELSKAVKQNSDFRLLWANDIGLDYARTLKAWRERFLERLPEVRALGFDDRFIRMWEYYLACCEAAFSIRYIGDHQILFGRPLAGVA